MRLIDADALLEKIDTEREILVKDGRLGTEHILVHYVREFIEDAPTIDRPQGEWIVNTHNYKSVCSVCGANETDFIYGTEIWYGLGESKFCPNCGARMKGVSDDA